MKSYLPAAFNILSRKLQLTALLLATSALTNQACAEYELSPYKASYNAKISGINAELQQTLTPANKQQWRMHSEVSALFITIDEEALFSLKNDTVTPHTYQYTNPLNSKRNSNLVFNPSGKNVNNTLISRPPFAIPASAQDKLSFQTQLRLDLSNDPTFKQKDYALVEAKRVKTYTLKVLAEETITTPAGTFKAVKLEQRRDNNEEYSLIWLAVEHEYFVLRIERIEEGETEFLIDLKAAEIAGEKI
ncbi:DUF3108 domain-containing protein [Oceanicoccus sp. KOV_DT_Chl]|uniref:DUF3108 domain-containing protein n=1 Tax=Oceanicoccus sp. KOV_DT_Chl TaxID=1904639 RepID=UPI000C7B076E|nr:DUF3108 domain-containing protein [Oceanicoccus sp. KOV_DT_Chl]